MAKNHYLHLHDTHTLAQAIVDTVASPLVVLDSRERVITVGRTFCTTFQVTPEAARGRLIFELARGNWVVGALRAVLDDPLKDDASVMFDVDIEIPDRGRRTMNLTVRKVLETDDHSTAMLVMMNDVTDARRADSEKDDLLAQRVVMLQEVRHRIANSLQIIASILLLKAGRAKSEEVREHLHDAHARVMSVTTVQRLLEQSDMGRTVEMGAYLRELCDGLSASMIRGPRPINLDVRVDDASMSAIHAVSLGLIVTELVINAIKHAFPDDREGMVTIAYRTHDSDWTLSVIDNGVGRPSAHLGQLHLGLGTSIIEALAHQLGARVVIADTGMGTSVSLIHAGPQSQQNEAVRPQAA
jgi:two-component sensor histidine kinase